jgi:2-keto-4-pentenoate hydratase/2-oxohepta-3-ene-1,7-dioic acid hydratase in catechol pathway
MDKIICVGKNYAEHAKELGDVVPEKPVLFLKPPSVLREAKHGERISAWYPAGRGSFHHECEIVLRLGEGGKISAVTVGLDMTLRDLQGQLKKQGHPWTVAKVFRDAAIVGPWVSVADFPRWQETPFSLAIAGKVRQRGSAAEMILEPAACVSYIAEWFPLCAGDLVFTGTPAGVGPVAKGETAELQWGDIRCSVAWG